jgi:hypothetical protein
MRCLRGGGIGSGVRRGNGEPVQMGRGVLGGLGVKTVLGGADAAAGLKGVGEARAPRAGSRTISRWLAGS